MFKDVINMTTVHLEERGITVGIRDILNKEIIII